MKSTSTNRFFLTLSILVGLVWGYSFSCHFLNLFIESWGNRILILLGTALFSGFHTNKLAKTTLPKWKTLDHYGPVLLAFTLTCLLYGLNPNTLPVFPMTRTLEITTLDSRNKASVGNVIEISTILNNNVPMQYFLLDGEWEQSGYSFRTTGIKPASLSYSQFMKDRSDFQILFKTSPDSGKVRITWDGVNIYYDLYSAKIGQNTVDLAPTFPWDKLGLMRQAFLVTASISDFLSLSILLLIFTTWLLSSISKIHENPFISKLCGFVIVLCLFVSSAWNIINLRTSTSGMAILQNPLLSNGLDDLLAHSSNYQHIQIYTKMAAFFSGRNLYITPKLINDYELDPELIRSIGRIPFTIQVSYPEELSFTEVQDLLRLNLQILVIPTRELKVKFITGSSNNIPVCVKTYQDQVFIGPVTNMPGCQGFK